MSHFLPSRESFFPTIMKIAKHCNSQSHPFVDQLLKKVTRKVMHYFQWPWTKEDKEEEGGLNF